jgi:hypothetical protein
MKFLRSIIQKNRTDRLKNKEERNKVILHKLQEDLERNSE